MNPLTHIVQFYFNYNNLYIDFLFLKNAKVQGNVCLNNYRLFCFELRTGYLMSTNIVIRLCYVVNWNTDYSSSSHNGSAENNLQVKIVTF